MSKHEYNGDPIDISWQTPPWQDSGETLNAYNSDGNGKITTTDWPENATDPEELNDQQKQMILTAVKFPNVNSPSELVELSGLDVSIAYPQDVLCAHWPERYWGDMPPDQDDEAEVNVDEVRQRLLDGGSISELKKEYRPGHKRLSRLVRGVAKDTPECDTPPLEWLGGTEQCWIIPEEYYDGSVETNYDNENRVTITEPVSELRRRALAGESATEIANDHGVSDRTIRKRLKGQYADGDPEVPPLEYNQSVNEWRMADGTFDDDEGEETSDTGPAHVEYDSRSQEPGRSGASNWAWAAVVALLLWAASEFLSDNDD